MGLLDWITDGGGSLFNSGPAAQAAGGETDPSVYGMSPSPPPMAAPAPPPAPNTPPLDPSMTDIAGGIPPGPTPYPQGTDPMSAGNGPTPAPRPAGAIPPPPPETPPGPPMNIAPSPSYPGLGVGAPPMPPPSQSGFTPPNMQGGGGLLGAFGLGNDTATRMRGGLAAGLKAAGSSAGLSPMQALAGGAGAAMEGGEKSKDTNQKQSIDYLNTAIKAKQMGNEAAYKTNYMQYLQKDLEASKDKTAGNKNDSPTQLYLGVQRLLDKDPQVSSAFERYKALAKDKGASDPEAIAAQAEYQRVAQERESAHLAAVGLNPKIAQSMKQMPGFSQTNPLDAGKMGVTGDNITSKLQPGMYYTNPKDGQVYRFKGTGNGADEKVNASASKPKPADPMNPERGSRPTASADEPETEAAA